MSIEDVMYELSKAQELNCMPRTGERISALEARQNEVGAALGRIEREMERLSATMEQGLMAIGANFQAIHKEIKKKRKKR